MVRAISVTGTVFLFLVVCSSAGTVPALAAEKVFDLRKAVEFSLHYNGELKALQEGKGVREAGRTRARLFPNPVLEMDAATGEISGSPSDNRFSIGISQEFLTMGKRGMRVRVADKDIEAFNRQVDDSTRLLTEGVTIGFCDLLLAEKRAELAERSVALNKQLLDVTRERLAAGDIPELELNLARVEVARSEGKRLDAERELYPVRARLLALMGLSPDEAATFAGSLESASVAKSLEELRMLALAERPDLRALEAEKARDDAAITLAQAEAVPNITAGLSYQREHSVVDVGGLEGTTRDNLIGLKVSIPLPVFDRNQAGIGEARARKASTETRHLFAGKTVEREVEAAFARYIAAEKSLTLYEKEIIPQLEENLKLVQEAYRLGEVGILAVIEEQKKFFEVNDGYLTALYTRRTALARLNAAVGVDVSRETTGGDK